MQTTYNLLIRAEMFLRHLSDRGALTTYQEFASQIGLMGLSDQWTPAIQREVADILKQLAALERRFTGAKPLDFRRVLSPTQVRLMHGGPDDAA